MPTRGPCAVQPPLGALGTTESASAHSLFGSVLVLLGKEKLMKEKGAWENHHRSLLTILILQCWVIHQYWSVSARGCGKKPSVEGFPMNSPFITSPSEGRGLQHTHTNNLRDVG